MRFPQKRALRLIKETRSKNNELWMSLIEIALTKAPQKTKKVLEQIQRNDLEVARLTRLLTCKSQIEK